MKEIYVSTLVDKITYFSIYMKRLAVW